LSRYFEQVTVIERDRYPDTPAPRKGVPQSRHTHFMLARGWDILEQLFPGLTERMISAGAPRIEQAADVMWLGQTGWYPRFPSGITTISCSRTLLEWGLLQWLAGSGSIRVLEATSVTGLLASPDGTTVTGVTATPYHPPQKGRQKGSGRVDESLPETRHQADFVVDASGRTSQTPQWLQQLGYDLPPENAIKPFVGYASRQYSCASDSLPDWKTLLIQSRPPHNNRAASLLMVENNRWSLTMSNVGGNYPPTSEEGFLAFAREMPTMLLYDFISQCKPESPIYGYRIPRTRMRHYEKMSRWPERFVTLGDAVCTFNPVYGQGMSVGAEGALAMEHCLHDHLRRSRSGSLDGLARYFQQHLAQVLSIPWMLSSGEDSRYPSTQGEGVQDNPLVHVTRWYTDGVIRYAARSPNAYQTLLELIHLGKPFTTLLQPPLVVNALACNIEAVASSIEGGLID
jgi:2-polyprenyl-6-methoxyphenol hydroxylase-like FAD-dependent oxidoreductase